MRSVEEDPALRRARGGANKRKLVENENGDGPRGSEAEREVKRQNQHEQPDQNMDKPSDDVRGTKRKAEDEGHVAARSQDGMIVSCV